MTTPRQVAREALLLPVMIAGGAGFWVALSVACQMAAEVFGR